jgi:F-type H+-transporting ATPase subunit b
LAEGAGGLFDFNATLPLMAIQFILLTVVLTFIFYKPISRILEERETSISANLTDASKKLLKADELYKQYDEQLKLARSNAQSIIANSEKEAKDIVSLEVNQARQDAAKLIQQTNKELEAQKSLALEKLETQVDELSQLIKEKLLGKQVTL